MRVIFVGVALSVFSLSVGCSAFNKGGAGRGPDAVKLDRGQPSAASMVNYLNDNARRITALRCADLTLDARQNGQTAAVSGRLDCQRPRNFRLTGRALGQPMVDIGSNEQEFWYWIAKAEPPYVFHCTHTELERGGVPMPFPFQPDMILAALGMAEYDPAKQYQVNTNNPRTVELIETITSSQGQPIRKVTIFARGPVGANQPQVVGHLLQDGRTGQEICSATITNVQTDPRTGAVIPRRVKLTWPAERVELSLKLDGAQVVTVEPQLAATLFTRQNLADLPSYDLARRALDNPGNVQRVGVPPR